MISTSGWAKALEGCARRQFFENDFDPFSNKQFFENNSDSFLFYFSRSRKHHLRKILRGWKKEHKHSLRDESWSIRKCLSDVLHPFQDMMSSTVDAVRNVCCANRAELFKKHRKRYYLRLREKKT